MRIMRNAVGSLVPFLAAGLVSLVSACVGTEDERQGDDAIEAAGPDGEAALQEPTGFGSDEGEDAIDEGSGDVDSASFALNTCPGAGRYCAHELGMSASNQRLYSCARAGATPVLYRSCPNYCAIAGADRYSFCANIARVNSDDRGVFRNPNLNSAGVLRWADASNPTRYGGYRLRAPSKWSDGGLTDAGVQCAQFARDESGAPQTSTWAPLDSDQLSIASAPDGTVVATFNSGRHYGYDGALMHTAMKCDDPNTTAIEFCDSNWDSTPSGPPYHVRRHTLTSTQLAKFRVVAIPN